MVKRSQRTRSTKKVKVRTPGARVTTHFRGERASKAQCGRCGQNLSGVATGRSTYVGSLPAGSRVPARPYAGILCPNCLDELVRYVTRMEVRYAVPEFSDLGIQRDLTIEKYLPRGWFADVEKGGIMKKTKKTKPGKKAKAASAPKAQAKHKAKKPKAK
jgi:large subunit ribosomal protein L34e